MAGNLPAAALHLLGSGADNMHKPGQDEDLAKGAVEQDRRSQRTNTSLTGQLPHRTENAAVKASDSDFPEPGENPEHSGEAQGVGSADEDEGCESTADASTDDPGHRQKRS